MLSVKRVLLSVVLLTLSPFLAGQSSATIHDVSIINFAFVPQTDTITVDDTVRWTNNGSFLHTSTSNTGLWNSGNLNTGQSFSFQFVLPGSYHYHCAIHPSMTGTIVVRPVLIHDVSIIDFAFLPQTDTVSAGDSVRWTNNGSFLHTSTSNTAVWNSGTLNPGQSFTFGFNNPQSYPYHCAFHPSMTGTIVVLSALRGDANGDGVVNSADVAYLINYLFVGGPAPHPSQTGDANCDGLINSADVAYLINYLFVGGPPPGC